MKKLLTILSILFISSIAYCQPINVKDAPYNATGNGITDDRAAIQRALDSGYAQSKPVYIPAGIYLMSTTGTEGAYANLRVKPGVMMYGDGDATILKRSASYMPGIAIFYYKSINDAAPLSARNYTFRNFKILGASTGRGYAMPGVGGDDNGLFLGTAANRMNRVMIDGITVESINKEAIAVWDAVECTIKNCRVYDANFSAYNPQKIDRLLMLGNVADDVSFAIEYDGKRTGAVYSSALFEGNSFTNVYEYGISVEAGDYVKISNNIISGQTGTSSVTGLALGIYFYPVKGNITYLEISGNQISNFVNEGIGTRNSLITDSVIAHLFIKNNVIINTGESAITLAPKSAAKIVKSEFSGNTIINWNRVNNGNSFSLSAIDLSNIDNVSVYGNRIYNKTGGLRNDPLYINTTSNIRFFDNDCSGPGSSGYPAIQVRKGGTNTNFIQYNNINLTDATYLSQ